MPLVKLFRSIWKAVFRMGHHEGQDVAQSSRATVPAYVPIPRSVFYNKPPPMAAILQLECEMRSSWVDDTGTVAELRHLPTETRRRLMATFSPNGRLREKAIRQLAGSPDTVVAAFVLLRLNDWVRQVRAAAEKWLEDHGRKLTISQLLECLPILAALRHRKHGDQSQWVDNLVQRIAHEATRDDIVAACFCSDPRLRQLGLDLLIMRGLDADPETVAWLFARCDPVPAVLLMKAIYARSKALPDSLVSMALASPSAMIRRRALYQLTDTQIKTRLEVLRVLLMDNSSSVRQFAQFHLSRTTPKSDLRSYYETLIDSHQSSGKSMATAIAGFHELGGKWSSEKYRRLYEHPSAKVRRVVLRMFGETRFEEALPTLLSAMESSVDTPLTKTAQAVLLQHPTAVCADLVREWVLDERRSVTARSHALTLLSSRGKWEVLSVLLELASSASSTAQMHAGSRLQVWLARYNISQVQPTVEQVSRLNDQLEIAGPSLEPHLRQALQALLARLLTTR
jgi:hypothetical protein